MTCGWRIIDPMERSMAGAKPVVVSGLECQRIQKETPDRVPLDQSEVP